MIGRLAVGLMGLLAHLPLSWLRAGGWALGRLLFVLAARRRKIVLRNLALCFPQVPEAQRLAWARRSFVLYCQTWLDRSWLWSAPQSVFEARVKLQGAVHELEGDTPTILFAPHFYGMDAGGLALPLRTPRAFTSIFVSLRNPDLDAWVRAGRQRFGEVRMLNRTEGVKPILSGLRKGGLLYLLPDMDFGPSESLFVPFYGVSAATVPSLSRFARLGRAKVLTMVTTLTPDGYVAELSPAWPDFPTEDLAADTARMNRELQAWIDRDPAQYYWVHKRFKTRPEGEASPY